MRRDLLTKCTNKGVVLPTELKKLGYRHRSRFYLYLLDYAKKRKSKLQELLVLPVNPASVDRLHNIQMHIADMPNATFSAFALLSDLEISILSVHATDSIRGEPGRFEALVLLKEGLSGSDLNKLVIEKVESEPSYRDYIKPVKKDKFVRCTRYGTRLRDLARHRVSDEIWGLQATVDTSTPTAESGFSDETSLVLEVPNGVVDHLNKRDAGNASLALSAYHASVSIERDFNAMSISFFDPSDIVVELNCEISSDRKVMQAISKHLGHRQVDFRILDVWSTSSGQHEFALIADFSMSQYLAFAPKTLSWVLYAELTTSLEKLQIQESAKKIADLHVDSLVGYPLRLPGFAPKDAFELGDIIRFDLSNEHRQRISETILNTLSESAEQTSGILAEVPNLGDVLIDNLSQWIEGKDVALLLKALEKNLELIEAISCEENVIQFKINQAGQDIPGTIALRRNEDSTIDVIYFYNQPPTSLINGFLNSNNNDFNRFCRHLLSNLDYSFRSINEFNLLTSAESGLFLEESNVTVHGPVQ